MPFRKPTEVRRSFDKDSKITKRRVPYAKNNPRMHRTNYWPGKKLDYEFLEKCKEVVCRVKHPNAYYKYKNNEYRVSIMRWSRGSYIDIRLYTGDQPRPMGILLHQDVITAILPDLVAAVHRLEAEDSREPDKIQKPEVLYVESQGNF